ncbi:MAG: hypothetical protein U9O94_08280, partial [Nanoarchaeota archaeon]|nr:hypothetical protein [Nanoarchaeota archaeon]
MKKILITIMILCMISSIYAWGFGGFGGGGGFVQSWKKLTGDADDIALYINNDVWIAGRNAADDAWLNMFKINSSDQIELGNEMAIGQFNFTADGGSMTAFDQQVSSTPVAGTEEGYAFKVDGNTIAKVYAEADNAGGIQSKQLKIGTTGLFSTTITLTTSQVNNLRATPIELVPAYGANTWIELVSVFLAYDYVTTAFTVAAGEDFVIEWADDTDATASIETTGFIDQADDEVRWYPTVLSAGADPEATLNQGLQIFNTGAGETSDGGTSTLAVKVTYRVYTT